MDPFTSNKVGPRTKKLKDETVLTPREAEITAMKEIGWTHQDIADELGVEKSTVDELSRRVNQKLERAKATVEELA